MQVAHLARQKNPSRMRAFAKMTSNRLYHSKLWLKIKLYKAFIKQQWIKLFTGIQLLKQAKSSVMG